MSIHPSNRNQIIWEIQRFSSSTQKTNAELSSRVCHTPNLYRTEWELELCISGPEQNHSISLYIKRCNSDSDMAPADLFLQVEVCFLDSIQHEHFRRYMKANFRKDSKRGFINYVKRNEIVEARRQLLPKDKLTVQCCLWKCRLEEMIPPINNISASIELEQPDFMWVLGSFQEWEPRTRRGMFVVSDVLCGSFEIFGLMHTESSASEPSMPKEVLQICIQPTVFPNKRIFFFAKVSILDKFYKPRISLKGQYFFEIHSKTPWLLGTILMSTLTDPSLHILDHNTLNMRCEFVVTDGKQATETRERFTPVMEAFCSNSKTLPHDMESSFESTTFSDIQLKVEGKYFPAHRLILGARSPVFQEVLKKAEAKRKSLLEQPLTSTATLPRGVASGVDRQRSCSTSPPSDCSADSNTKNSFKKSRQHELSHEDSESNSDKVQEENNDGKGRTPPVVVSESNSGNIPLSSEDSESDYDPEKQWALTLDSEPETDGIKIKQEPIDSDPDTYKLTSTPLMVRSRRRCGELRTLHSDSPSSDSDELDMETYARYLASDDAMSNLKIESDASNDVLESSHDITIWMTNEGYVAEIALMNRETLQQMLQCMYMDSVDRLDVDCAVKLFRVGEKYQFQLLMEKCEAFLKSCISLPMVYFLLTLSDVIPINGLKKAVLEFIESNLAVILVSEGWRIFAERQEGLANTVMRYLRNKSNHAEEVF